MPHKQKPTQGRYGREWHDGKAPDGFTVNGWRRIAKGGYIRFCQGKRYHEKFKEWAGLWVFAEVEDGWGVDVIVWPDEPWKDRRTVLYCTNESDWLAVRPPEAYGPHKHEKREKNYGADISTLIRMIEAGEL